MKKSIAKFIVICLLVLSFCPMLPSKAASSTDSVATIATYVQTLIGKSYKAATAGPNTFDASGLVTYTFKEALNFNISSTLGRSCQKMYNTCKTNKMTISTKKLEAGDLVFYGKTTSKITFMGIYIGKNKVVVCNSTKGVIKSNLNAAGGKNLPLIACADTSAILTKYQTEKPKVTVPAKVANLKVSSSTETSIKLTWKKVSDATSYTIYRYLYNKDTYIVVGKTAATSYTVSKLPSATGCCFRVAASNEAGEGTRSSYVNAITKPTKVNELSVKAASSTSLAVTWNKVKNVTGYKVVYATKSDFSNAKTVTVSTNKKTISELLGN